MKTKSGSDNKQFYIRLGVIVGAVIVVIVTAKILIINPLLSRSRGLAGSAEQSTGYSTETSPSATGVISWQEAGNHIGQFGTVEGRIVATYNSGKACFLNFHPDYKRYFTAVIFARNFSQFPTSPENYYYGKTVQVTGLIKEYQGKPEIILNDQSQIKIVR